MPLKLNVGVSRKIGLPEYSSAGATCNVELELESRLLESDLEAFHAQVRAAYDACHRAVNDELARLQAQIVPPATDRIRINGSPDRSAPLENGRGHHTGTGLQRNGAPDRTGDGAQRRSSKPATNSQVKAICAIARNQQINLGSLLRDEYGVDHPEDLSLAQASAVIDRLKAACPA
jgi:hypothetical protein